MPIQNAAKVVNGVVTAMIVVDTAGSFDYSAAGYILAGNGIGIGWIQQSDGFAQPAVGLTPITTAPNGPISVSTSYAAKLATNLAAQVTARTAYDAAITAGQTQAQATAAASAAYTAAGGT